MNTQQIDAVLYSACPVFLGTHAIDKLPRFCSGGAYVINLDPSTGPGTHWVAVYSKLDSIDYFDSYGNEPPAFLKRWWGKNKNYQSNPMLVQGPFSSVCGQYCIYFILQKFRGCTMRSILTQFSDDVDTNDRQIYDYIMYHFNLVKPNMIDSQNILMQVAEALQTWRS